MNSTNTSVLYYSNFLDARHLSKKQHTHTFIWYGLVVVEVLLFVQLVLGYFAIHSANTFAYVIHTLTEYITYPFAFMLENVSGSAGHSWVTILAIIGYFLIALILMHFFKTGRSTRARIERARKLSRRKYRH